MSTQNSRRFDSLAKIETAITTFLASLPSPSNSILSSDPSSNPEHNPNATINATTNATTNVTTTTPNSTPTLHLGTLPPLPLLTPSPTSTKRLAIILRILSLIHAALHADVVVTKRDIYYKDPELFGDQRVVDRVVDHLAAALGTTRAGLNVAAAAKGLVCGEFVVRRGDGEVVRGEGKEGVLVPRVGEGDVVVAEGMQWILVVEKEATFSGLVSAGLVRRDDIGRGIMITGKGYPDLLTRAFLRRLSMSNARKTAAPDVLALVDFDPDGLAIMSTYRYGSDALSHEDGLMVPQLQWLGVKSEDLVSSSSWDGLEGDMSQERGVLRLCARDRAKAVAMLERGAQFPHSFEAEWRHELQVMLMLNMKAEIQLLDERTGGLMAWLGRRLAKYNRSSMGEENIILDV